MKKLLLMFVFCFQIIMMAATCSAEVKVAQAPGPAAISGSNIYYVKNDGLYRFNIKNKSNQLIKTGSFSEITVKGNYIYYVEARNFIDADCNTYFAIYRMKKNGTNVKRIAYGDSPVILGKWIFYIEHKLGDGPSTGRTGYIAKMKLNGSSKKRIKKANATALFQYGNSILYSKTLSNDDVRSNVDFILYTMKGKKKSYEDRIRRCINCYREQYTYNGYTSMDTHYLRLGKYLYYGKRTNYKTSYGNSVTRVKSLYRKRVNGGNEELVFSTRLYSVRTIFALSKYIILEVYSDSGTGGTGIVILNADGKIVTEL